LEIEVDAMRQNVERASRLLGAMANEKRLLILCQLVNGERTVNELAKLLGIRQSTVSQHLTLLRKDGLVEARRDGQSQIYTLAGPEAEAVIETMYSLYCGGKR
jgi:DNA-binding transcriptional ArsR family regulator